MKNLYYPPHVHLNKGSVGDSILKIDDYIKKAKEYGLKKLIITNHGSLSDMYDFYFKCLDNGIDPIIGCEIYESDNLEERQNNHLILISKNKIGLRNLIKILSKASVENFYYKPKVTSDLLKLYGKGLIGLSACVAGKIPQMIINNESFEKVNERINFYKKYLDDFYLEIQPGNFEEQIIVNQSIIELSNITNTKIIASNDIHYLDKEDWKIHDYHVKLAQHKDINAPMVYPDKCYYFMDYNEILESLCLSIKKEDAIIAINNTEKLFNQLNKVVLDNSIKYPNYDVPNTHNKESYINKLCYNKLNEIKNGLNNFAAYVSRLEYELETISILGFSGYFLIVRDFLKFAEDNDIEIGPGRGSCCASLVAYLLGITKIDPIKYDLMFERFISKWRKGTFPDIDSDIASNNRSRLFDYVVNKYGKDKCALVSTFGYRKAKAAIRDTGKLFDIDKELIDKTAKLIPIAYYDEDGEKETDLDIEDALKVVPEFRKIRNQYPEWINAAIKLENLPRQKSIHAAGTIITSVNLEEYVPLIKSNSENILATALELDSVESIGFLKFDFLGLGTLDIISNMKKKTKDIFDYRNNNYDDDKVWNIIGSKHTTGLFQISSNTYKQRMGRLKPKSIKELANCLALLRSPCITAKQDIIYMEILEGKRTIEKIHPVYDKATNDTLGILLYQEQLMNTLINIGFDKENSFTIMKCLAKKKVQKIQEYKKEYDKKTSFLMDKKTSEKIWKILEDASLYLFNMSHAIAYATLTYASAYYRIYYPLEFLAETLSYAYLKKKNIKETIEECFRIGIKFLQVDINKSDWYFSVENDKIRIGICAIKSFGDKAYECIKQLRPFSDFEDFMDRVPKNICGKRSIVPAIWSNSFYEFGDRLLIYNKFCDIRNEAPLDEIKIQGSTPFKIDSSCDFIEEQILAYPILSHPVNFLNKINFDKIKNDKHFEIQGVITKIKKIKDKNENKMAFITLLTADCALDCVIFSNLYNKYKKEIKLNNICYIKAIKGDTCKIKEIV